MSGNDGAALYGRSADDGTDSEHAPETDGTVTREGRGAATRVLTPSINKWLRAKD